MRIIVIVLLLFGAQFVLTAFAPAEAGKGWFLWPFAGDSKPWLGMVGGLPSQSGSVTPILAGIAGLCFLGAALALIGWFVPADWWRPLVLVASGASLVLFALYIGPWSIAPLILDGFLLWGVLAQNWSVSILNGA